MATEVLKEIRDIEIAAENLKKQALAREKDIIKAATEQADKELKDSTKKAQEKASSIIKQKEDEAREEAKKILEAGNRDCDSIKAVSEEKVQKAVNLVIERIVTPYGSS